MLLSDGQRVSSARPEGVSIMLAKTGYIAAALVIVLAVLGFTLYHQGAAADGDLSVSAAENNDGTVRPYRGEAPRDTETNDSGTGPDDWRLILVNAEHTIPDGYSVELTPLKNGQYIDSRAYPDLQRMMDDMRACGLRPVICSSYRTVQKQQSLYDDKVRRCMDEGLDYGAAVIEARTWVAVPGTSEHHTGLALDIVDESYQLLDEGQENTPVQRWLMQNSYRYGFVLRYPPDKRDITGIAYEPWHYRYVGTEAAKAMHDSGICLEEYTTVRP